MQSTTGSSLRLDYVNIETLCIQQVNLIKDPGYITVSCLAFNLASQVSDHVTYPQTWLAKYPLMCIQVCHLYPFGVVL